MSRARASIVRASTLAEVAADLGLGDEIQLGRGEEATGGREKPSILADAMEALIGAAHLDGGAEASRAVVTHLLGDRIAEASGAPWDQDDKSRLQEHVSRTRHDAVRYVLESAGPEHDKTFRAEVVVSGEVHGRGVGRSKKQAEQAAARDALTTLMASLASEAAIPLAPVVALGADPSPADRRPAGTEPAPSDPEPRDPERPDPQHGPEEPDPQHGPEQHDKAENA